MARQTKPVHRVQMTENRVSALYRAPGKEHFEICP